MKVSHFLIGPLVTGNARDGRSTYSDRVTI